MSIPITTTTKISTPRMSILGVDTNTKSGALQYRLCEGVGDMPPVKYFEILHAQKRVLGAPETLFRACSSDGRYRRQNIDISDTGVTATGIDT